MPRTKKSKSSRSAKSTKSMHEMIDTKTEGLLSPDMSTATELLRDPSKVNSLRWGVVVVLLVLVAAVYLGSRGYIVAAMVDGKPIFGWDVNHALVSRYGAQTLESMISERLIAEAARKQGVVISQKDVEVKIADLVKSLGPNVKIEDLLKYQGMTRTDFENQVRLQLTVEKVLGKDVAVADSDISDFMDKNKENLVATDEAGMREEARQAVMSQKINEKIQPWFAELKAKAKIVRLFK